MDVLFPLGVLALIIDKDEPHRTFMLWAGLHHYTLLDFWSSNIE